MRSRSEPTMNSMRWDERAGAERRSRGREPSRLSLRTIASGRVSASERLRFAPPLIFSDRLVNLGLERLECRNGLHVEKRQDLRGVDAGHASCRVDPVGGIGETRPSKRTRRAPRRQWFRVDKERKPPLHPLDELDI